MQIYTPNEPTLEDSAGESNRSPTQLSKRALARWRMVLSLGVGVGLFGWLLGRVDLAEVGQALVGASLSWLVWGIVSNLCTPWWRAVRFRHLYGIRGRKLEITALMAQYGLMNMLLPLRTGDVAMLGLLKARGAIPTIAEALPRWIVLRAADLACVLGLMIVTAFFAPVPASFAPWMLAAQVVLVLLAIGAVIGFLLLPRMTESSMTPPPGFLRGRWWALRRGLAGLDRRSALAVVFLLTAVLWLWQAGILALQYAAFPLGLSPVQVWVVGVAVLATTILPIHAPLAVGTFHVAQIGVLKACGVPLAQAMAAAIGIHAAMVLSMLGQGAIGTLMLAIVDWRQNRAEAAAALRN